MFPVCASCEKVRDDKGYWNQIESNVKDHPETEFSHGICLGCAKKPYPESVWRTHFPLLAAGLESELKKIILSTEDSLRLAAGNLQFYDENEDTGNQESKD